MEAWQSCPWLISGFRQKEILTCSARPSPYRVSLVRAAPIDSDAICSDLKGHEVFTDD